MKLSLKLVDERRVITGNLYTNPLQPPKYETYDRSTVELDGDAFVIAGFLRGLADSITPGAAFDGSTES